MPKLRIALAQVNSTVGDLANNAQTIVDWTRRAAERGADLAVFPEMMLTGYPVEDLALRASFVDASISMLYDLAGRPVPAPVPGEEYPGYPLVAGAELALPWFLGALPLLIAGAW